MKIFDESRRAGRGFSRFKENRDAEGKWYEGEVITPQGIVSVYADSTWARLYLACRGRFYMRNFTGRSIGRRELVTLAKRFAKEIVER